MAPEKVTRVATAGAIAVAVIAIVLVLTSSGSSYVLHAQFQDAGQLVAGDLVTVAGHEVGSVGAINLSPNGLADIELKISDSSVTPIRQGTLATIGQLSLTGVANRFVGLTLGGGSPIHNGGTLPSTQTRGITDLDTVLDSLTPHVRASLQQILKTGAYFVGQPTASSLNRLALYLNPALSQTAGLTAQIGSQRSALSRLLSSTSQVTSALAPHSGELAQAVTGTAAALREVASRRTDLQDAIARTPQVLAQGKGVLADLDFSLGVLDPALRDLQPVAPRLATLLKVVVPAAREAIPTIRGVQALVPSAKKALLGLPPVERKATPAVKSLTTAIKPIIPLLGAFRAYAPEVTAGFFEAFGGSEAQGYDANGHYIRVQPVVAGNSTSASGALSLLGGVLNTVSPLNGQQTGMLARCPGGGTTPATAGGNPWSDLDAAPGVCDPNNDAK